MKEGREYNFLYQNEKSSEGYLGEIFEHSNRSSKDFYEEFFMNEQKTTCKKTIINLDDKRKEYSVLNIAIKKPFIIKEKSRSSAYPERKNYLKEQLKILFFQRKFLLKKEKKYFPKEERETKKNVKYRIFHIKKRLFIFSY